MDARTDRELVLECWPDALAVSRPNPFSGVTEYRVEFQPVSGRRRFQSGGWFPGEGSAWQAASARLGLRVRRD